MTDGQSETQRDIDEDVMLSPEGINDDLEPSPDVLLDRFVVLENDKRELEVKLERIKTELKRIQPHLLDDWADRGIQNMKVRGRTVYIRNDFFCNKKGGVDTADICEALTEAGCGYMVKEGYAPATLKSRVKDWLADGEDQVPEALAAMLNWDTVPRLVTKS